jgi:hypothetical protein
MAELQGRKKIPVLNVLRWGPSSGTLVKGQGSRELISDYGAQRAIRSKCFGTVRAWTQCKSVYLYAVTERGSYHRMSQQMLALCVIKLPFSATPSTVWFRFTTIHFYDPLWAGSSTPELWCITVATQASFLYLVGFLLFSRVHVFLLFLF